MDMTVGFKQEDNIYQLVTSSIPSEENKMNSFPGISSVLIPRKKMVALFLIV